MTNVADQKLKELLGITEKRQELAQWMARELDKDIYEQGPYLTNVNERQRQYHFVTTKALLVYLMKYCSGVEAVLEDTMVRQLRDEQEKEEMRHCRY
jgi:hypothetical protein